MPKKRTKRYRKQRGRGKTSRFFKNLTRRTNIPIMPEDNEELENIKLKVSEKPSVKGTRRRFFNRLLNPSILPISSTGDMDLLDEEPTNKISFNENYYNSRNNSPINIDVDKKDIDIEEIDVTIGGKKRKYKKRK